MKTIISRDCVVYQDKLYFITEGNAFPAVLDYDENIIKYLPISSKVEIQPIDLALSMGSKIYFLYVSGKGILEYDVETFSANEIIIDCNQDSDDNYAFATIVKNQVYIFTKKMKKIVIFDTSTKCVGEKPYPANMGEASLMCGCIQGDYIWLFPETGNKIFSYCITSGQWKQYKFPIQYHNSLHAVCGKEYLYLLTWNGEVYEFRVNDLENKLITSVGMDLDKGKSSRILYAEEKILILPGWGNDFYLFDLKQSELKKIAVWPDDVYFAPTRKKWFKFYGYCEDEKFFYFANRTSNYYLRIEKNLEEFFWSKVSLPSGDDNIKNLLSNRQRILMEYDFCLNDYIAYIEETLNYSALDSQIQSAGNKIWDAVSGC